VKTILIILALRALTVSAFAADIPATAAKGQKISFIITTGNPDATVPLTYVMFRDGTQIEQVQEETAKSHTFVLTNVQPEQAGAYTFKITNSVGEATSGDSVILKVGVAPGIPKIDVVVAVAILNTTPPTYVVRKNSAVNLAALSTGTGPISYEFVQNGTLRAQSSPFAIKKINPSYAGEWWITARNAYGQTPTSINVLVQ
jgi:hypothetical protein